MPHIGLFAAIGCFTLWGLFPIYWKQLEAISAVQLALHRIVWSCVLLMVYLVGSRQLPAYLRAIASWRVVGIYTLSSVFIFTNWLLLVWAINAGYIIEGSLGYFINPLLNVALGVLFFHERLRWLQWVAISVAAAGVLVVAIAYASFPWIALTLATTFALYGYIKKLAPLNALDGLTLECMLLLPPSVVYLVVAECNGSGAFSHVDTVSNLMLVGGGVVTIAPLLLFAIAAPRISLSLLGVTQYVAPSIQFLLGVFLYNEPFSTFKLIGFILVWAALLLYTMEGLVELRRAKIAAANRVQTPPVDSVSSVPY
ncbi:RarD protein, partial [Saprolegnia parasitica CBS 223.65]